MTSKLRKQQKRMQKQQQQQLAEAQHKRAVAEHHETAEQRDPYEWKDFQLEWFRHVMWKDNFGHLAYICFIVWGASLMERHGEMTPPIESHTVIGVMSPIARIAGTGICAFIAILTIWIDVARGTPAERTDEKFPLLRDSLAGHFSYLTFNILTTHMLYWPCCFVAELVWYYSEEIADTDTLWTLYAKNLLMFCYTVCVFTSTLGLVLTILFLKFNWFEPGWRKEVLGKYHARGLTTFGPKMLFTHLNQTPIAFIDVFFLKDDELLRRATMSPSTLFLVSLVYLVLYVSWTHVNYRINGGNYPYPIFHKVLSSWKIEIPFLMAIATFNSTVAMLFYAIATYY